MFKDTDFVKKYSYTDVINPDYTQIKEHYEEIEPFIVVYRSKPIKRNSFKINREKP